jgi:hypothetical protein
MIAANGRLDETHGVAGGPFELILAEGHRYLHAAGVAPKLTRLHRSEGGLRACSPEMLLHRRTN